MYNTENQINLILNGLDKFQSLSKAAHKMLLMDGITLNFKGFIATIEDIACIDTSDHETALRSAKELIYWQSYMRDVSTIVNMEYHKYENKVGYMKAFVGCDMNNDNRFAKELDEGFKRLKCYKGYLVFLSRLDKAMGDVINYLMLGCR